MTAASAPDDAGRLGDGAGCDHEPTEMCGACAVFVCPLCDEEVPTGDSCACGVSEAHFGRWGMPAVPSYRTREAA